MELPEEDEHDLSLTQNTQIGANSSREGNTPRGGNTPRDQRESERNYG